MLMSSSLLATITTTLLRDKIKKPLKKNKKSLASDHFFFLELLQFVDVCVTDRNDNDNKRQ